MSWNLLKSDENIWEHRQLQNIRSIFIFEQCSPQTLAVCKQWHSTHSLGYLQSGQGIKASEISNVSNSFWQGRQRKGGGGGGGGGEGPTGGENAFQLWI